MEADGEQAAGTLAAKLGARLNTYLAVVAGKVVDAAKVTKCIKTSKPDRPIMPRRRPIR